MSGEDAVKAAGKKYLPRLDSQSDDDYAAYMARAAFFGATARTLGEYLDLIFRREPAVGLGERKALRGFVVDCDLWGMDFQRYGRQVVGEVLSVGRCGSLVMGETGGRPVVSLWKAEDIVNWNVERVGQVATLTEVVLRDAGRLRVLRLEGKDGAYECLMEVWEAAKDQSDEKDQKDWTLVETQVLMREGHALTFIPFVFHGPRHSRPEPDRLPLGEIIAANLDHYRLDADYKHGLHFAAWPTPWVAEVLQVFESGFTTIFLCASRAGTLVYGTLSGGVMVAQESLELFVMVRIHAGQPTLLRKMSIQALLTQN